MATSPKEPVAVAVVGLPKPFPTSVTFFKEKINGDIPPGTLWFNSDGQTGKDEKGWTTVLPKNEVTMTAGTEITTTAHFWWDSQFSKLGYYSNTKAGETLPGSTNVDVLKALPTSTARAGSTREEGSQTVSSTQDPTGNPSPSPASGESMTAATTVPTDNSPASNLPDTQVKEGGHSGLSGGAVAGVAIGCLLAGALIAGILAWFCLKRRKPTAAIHDNEASTVALMRREKGPMTKTVSVSSGSPITAALENGLPQPLEDKAISGEISKISNSIKNHVQSYYHTRAVSPGMIDYDDLQALGDNLPVSVGTLSTLLNNSATREIALRFCIAWVVTSGIQPNHSSNTTFLPPEVARCIQSMAHVEHGSKVHSQFYIKWRALTAELLQSTYVRNPFSGSDGRILSVQAAAQLLDNVLRSFADSRMDDGARSRNLEEILKRSAQFAFTLFSQPTGWGFDWQNEQSIKSGSLCIFPALVQVADEHGEPINPPRPFSDAVNRRLDE